MTARPDESVVHGSKASLMSATSESALARPQDLPAVDRLLRAPGAVALVAEHGHTLVAGEARTLLDGLRAHAVAGTLVATAVAARGPGRRAGPACAPAAGTALETRHQPHRHGHPHQPGPGPAGRRGAGASAGHDGRPQQPGIRPGQRWPGRPRQRGGRTAVHAHRRRGRHGGEQQRGGRAAEHRGDGGRARSDRLAWRTGGDWWRLPHARRDGQCRCHPGGGGHHQPHPPARLRARHQRAHRAGDEGAHQQLRGAGLHRGGGRGHAGTAVSCARRATGHRPGFGRAGRSGEVGLAARAAAAGDAGGRLRRRHLQRRQAAGGGAALRPGSSSATRRRSAASASSP